MQVEIAYALAKHAHRWQERKELDAEGHPIRYFEHLRATALVLVDELDIFDHELIIACLMHDSIEDTTDINAPMLERLFGGNVARMVKLLTKDPKEGYYNRLYRYADANTITVKACDRISNMRTLSGCSPEFQQKQIEETSKVLLPILMNPRVSGDPRVAAARRLLLQEYERNNWQIH